MTAAVTTATESPVANRGDDLRVLMYLYFPGGGIGRYTAQLMPELSALGATVEAAVVPDFQWRNSDGLSTWPRLKSISHPNPLRRKVRFLIGQFVNPHRLATRAKQFRPDIIHICHINHLSYPAWERRFPKNGPLLAVSVHDVERQKGILCKPWEARQLKRFYRRADVLFVHGENQARDLIDFAGVNRDRVHVVPHGPYEYPAPTESRSETRHRFGIPENANLGLAFGLIRDGKNYDRLIEALVHQPPDVHLLVAGNDVPKHRPLRNYQRLAERHGVGDRVHFVSRFIPDEDVGNLFQASDWAALTYSLDFTSQSGVLNSAVQFGLPVLATPTAIFSESLETFSIGVLCSDDSVGAIGDGISALGICATGDLEFKAYLSANSWQQNARLTLQAYASARDKTVE